MTNTKYLQERYKEGFVPGPADSLESFEMRVNLIKEVMKSPDLFLKKLEIPYDKIVPITPYFLTITSKKKLPFWYGAMTWICEYQGNKIPILELPEKTRGIGLKKEDLIAHEKIHFLRAAFSEPRFEEILAYRTSRAKWRKYFGPIFEKPWESHFCLILLLTLSLSAFLPLLFMQLAMWVTTLYLLFILSRLFLNQWIFKRALKKLSQYYKNSEELITLFTDKEIVSTAFSSYKELDKTSLRWNLINEIALT